MDLTREQVLGFRVVAQGLTAAPGSVAATKVPILDLGVQETGPDGAAWALAVRGARPGLDGLAFLWSLRGAPHAYRRRELGTVVQQLVPLSQADAASRIFDASKPLAAAGVPSGAALAEVAQAMRALVARPMAKGDVSTAITSVLPEPFVRWCNACRATHLYEQTFRLGAMFGGLELRPGTSPPVLSRVKGWTFSTDVLAGLPDSAPGSGRVPGDDLLLAAIGLVGPAGATDLAKFLDAPVKDIRARVAAMVADGRLFEVTVEGSAAFARSGDERALGSRKREVAGTTRLLGPYDLFVQGRDRALLVPDKTRHKQLWPVLGRPGAVLAGAEVVGTWRPRSTGKRLRLLVEPWQEWDARLDKAVDEQAELLAAFRGVEYAGRA